MARLVYPSRANEDLQRLYDFLQVESPAWAVYAIDVIVDGLNILKLHPLIGRPTGTLARELVISKGKTGYLALYEYDESRDVALVLAIRHQREAGYQ